MSPQPPEARSYLQKNCQTPPFGNGPAQGLETDLEMLSFAYGRVFFTPKRTKASVKGGRSEACIQVTQLISSIRHAPEICPFPRYHRRIRILHLDCSAIPFYAVCNIVLGERKQENPCNKKTTSWADFIVRNWQEEIPQRLRSLHPASNRSAAR